MVDIDYLNFLENIPNGTTAKRNFKSIRKQNQSFLPLLSKIFSRCNTSGNAQSRFWNSGIERNRTCYGKSIDKEIAKWVPRNGLILIL
jgi:hypothetical protein